MPRLSLVSAVSGGLWALLAWAVGRAWLSPSIWFGVAVSPIIGVFIGRLAWQWRGVSLLSQVVLSLVLLYLAVATFGLATGIGRAMTHLSPDIRRGAVILETIVGVLYWLTLSGAVAVLWPATWLNVRMLWSIVPANHSDET